MLIVKRLILLVISLAVLSCSAFCDEEWEDMTGPIGDLDLQAIAIDPLDSNIIFVGSAKRLYKSVDGGENWEDVFTVYGDGGMNFIAIDKKDAKIIYIATSNGLFRTPDRGNTWRRVFKGIGDGKKEITCLTIHPFDADMIYAGTGEGLFRSKDRGASWQEFSSGIGNARLNFIEASPTHPDTLYVATSNGAFKTTDFGAHWQRVFIAGAAQATEEIENNHAEGNEEQRTREVNCIAVSAFDPDRVYLGSEDGVFVSKNNGRSWQRLSSIGLKSKHIESLALSERFVYAATDKGVFKIEEEKDRWQELHKGIMVDKISMLTLDAEKANLWSVGDGGVFKITLQSDSSTKETGNSASFFDNEPTIREIQQAAIRYAEVSPGKIRGWRMRARFRPLLPELSLDYDKTINYDSGADRYYVGPYDWGVSVKWDLADLIWNPYQKDIDVRSRLMVQLRDDVLDEVTHLYYERRRLQKEMSLFPAKDAKDKLDKELRLQELTAGIDALTEGYLSKRLSE